MKLHVPLAITFLTALFMIGTFFVPHYASGYVQEEVEHWVEIVTGLALGLGVASLIQAHLGKALRRQRDWGYSVVVVVAFVVMSVLGIGWGVTDKTPFNWVFMNVYTPLEATMFSVLAFFVASAAYRTFRARTMEAALLLISALLVMFGRVPLGEMIWHRAPAVAEWIMSFPATAGKRAILLGVSLGAIATALRIMLGIERSHLGGD